MDYITVKEKVENMLVEMGMFHQQAFKVMDIAIPIINELSDDYDVLWNEHWDVYGEDMYEFLFSIVKPEALKWIDDNIPSVWFRDKFV